MSFCVFLTLCLLTLCGFMLGDYLSRVSTCYLRLLQKTRHPTAQILVLALIRTLLPRPTRQHGSVGSRLILCTLLAAAAVSLWLVPLPGLLKLALFIALAILLLSAAIDARTSLLPDALTLPLLGLGLALALSDDGLVTPEIAVTGVLVSYLALNLLSEIYRLIRHRTGLGGGDIKLIAAVSAWLGWNDALWIVFIGSVFGLLLALWQRKSLSSAMPFGPPLIAATLLILIYRVAEHV